MSSMTLRIPTKVLIHVWSYDFYDMTLSTGKQRRHMINLIITLCLGSIETHSVISELCYNEQNNQFGSQDMAVLF